MELNKKALVKVALRLFLLGITATVDARFDPSSFITQVLSNGDNANYYVKSTTTAWCDNCYCTKTVIPVCQCADIGETCHSACTLCVCTPLCRCLDTTSSCYDKCSSSEAQAHKE